MDLNELTKRYEEIVQSDRPEEIKTNQLSMLLMYMEGAYSIPIKHNEDWVSNNSDVFALYRKILKSRNLD